jgi:NAD-dependent dihydropyrimidine dehydrogenase PreA subunit
MAHKRRLGYRYEFDDPDMFRKDVEEGFRKAVTIPVNVEIIGEHRVLNYDTVKEILMNASRISLADCVCRTKRPNCDKPIRTCIGVNAKADRILSGVDNESGWPGYLNPQEIEVDKALSVLKMSHEAGLVHMALTNYKDVRPEDIDFVCSCCTCCCSPLGGIIRYGMAPHLLTSEKIAVTDEQACNDCGVCEDRCQFGAREMVDGSHTFNQDLCFGCGLCVSTCPTNAITLIDKTLNP